MNTVSNQSGVQTHKQKPDEKEQEIATETLPHLPYSMPSLPRLNHVSLRP